MMSAYAFGQADLLNINGGLGRDARRRLAAVRRFADYDGLRTGPERP